MGFGVWGLGFAVCGLRFAVCGLAHLMRLMRLMRLARPTGPSLLPAAAIESPRRSRTTAHPRARTRFRRDVGRAFAPRRRHVGPVVPTAKNSGNWMETRHMRSAPAAAAIHVRSLSTSEAYPLRVRCLAGAKRAGAGASAHARRCAAVVFSRCAPPTLIRACARWLIGGESATARRPAALALGTEAARVQREAHARHRVTASPHADGHRRRRPREAPITSARPPRPKPAGARRGRPGSRADQGNAFVPSNAATANPETFVSWSGEPG
ncbi:30S ribosomal S20 domain protein [Burkholderia pseudomallei]|nr:30S ribosomal S20 domain protein [Burkholderia pseudomallei]